MLGEPGNVQKLHSALFAFELMVGRPIDAAVRCVGGRRSPGRRPADLDLGHGRSGHELASFQRRDLLAVQLQVRPQCPGQAERLVAEATLVAGQRRCGLALDRMGLAMRQWSIAAETILSRRSTQMISARASLWSWEAEPSAFGGELLERAAIWA